MVLTPTTSERKSLPRLTDRLPLGRTGLEVSPICLGVVRDDDIPSRAFDLGVNFFFLSADMHWPVYEPLRRGLTKLLERGGEVRDQIVVAGVSYLTQPEFCTTPFLELLEAVPRLERVDVAIAGGAYGTEVDRRLPVFQRHRSTSFAGIRAIGASFHDRTAAVRTIHQEQLDIAFIRYNPLFAGARKDLFPELPQSRSTLLFGFTSTIGHVSDQRLRELGQDTDAWRPDVVDHYRFALTPPPMQGLLCAFKARQLEALIPALEAGGLTPAEEDYMIELASLDRTTAAARSSGTSRVH